MLFSNLLFIGIFFPISVLVYYLLFFNRTLQNIWLVIVGVLFFSFGSPLAVLLLILSIVCNWGFGIGLKILEKREKSARVLFLIACSYNILILFVFKHLLFSFFILHAISYIVDIYKKEIQAEKNILYVALYLSFFPKLLAGPIVSYASFGEQMKTRKSTMRKNAVGICRFVIGLAKKTLIAGNLMILVDLIFSYSSMGRDVVQVPLVMAWLGCIALSLQIYYDVSGYSDMAIGLSLIFGFQLEENFQYPYAASSVSGFWRRWHITLMNWFRQYVYFPLGGSEVNNKDKMVRNLFILWLAIGLWHGAKSTFVLWAIWNFFLVLLERFFGYAENNEHVILMRVYTVISIVVGWVLLRAQDMYQAGQYYKNMFAANHNGFWNGMTGFLLKEYGGILLLAVIFALPIAKKVNTYMVENEKSKWVNVVSVCYPIVMLALFLLSISFIVNNGNQPFFYFQF